MRHWSTEFLSPLFLISIHAPLAGCDVHAARGTGPCGHFNPRTPCGVRRTGYMVTTERRAFQSTHPLRGATLPVRRPRAPVQISIHAPLAGCDPWALAPERPNRHFNPRTPCGVRHEREFQAGGAVFNFNPRTPCGVRRRVRMMGVRQTQFQSTHPLRGATWLAMNPRNFGRISIHAPLAGCDYILTNFNTTIEISIHTPLAGCDTQQ